MICGNTAHTAAVGLTVCFLASPWGMVLGPPRDAICAPTTTLAGDGFLLVLAVKFLLALLLLGPAGFLIGGTYPVLGHAIVARPDALGTLGTSLYGVNTIGAAAGAFAAGFVLPAWIGFTGAYLLAMAINVAIGAWALRLAPGADAAKPPAIAATMRDSDRRAAWIWIIACGSGVLTLGLEVAWTWMFAQVLENSVYTFSTISSSSSSRSVPDRGWRRRWRGCGSIRAPRLPLR